MDDYGHAKINPRSDDVKKNRKKYVLLVSVVSEKATRNPRCIHRKSAKKSMDDNWLTHAHNFLHTKKSHLSFSLRRQSQANCSGKAGFCISTI